MQQLIHLDLFSGIGGFALAMQQAEIKPTTTYFSDICEFGNKVYAKNFPDAIPLGDIKEINGSELKNKHTDAKWIITFGFPCQDASTAGREQRGLDGHRTGLWSYAIELVRQIQPNFYLAENVDALTSQGLDRCLRDNAKIGFDAEWSIIPASHIGAAHIRKRIWIVGYAANTSQALRRKQLSATKDGRCLGAFQQSDAKTDGLLLRTDWEREMGGCSNDPESYIVRAYDGISGRMDRNRVAALGNAIVPQVAAMILNRCKIFL